MNKLPSGELASWHDVTKPRYAKNPQTTQESGSATMETSTIAERKQELSA